MEKTKYYYLCKRQIISKINVFCNFLLSEICNYMQNSCIFEIPYKLPYMKTRFSYPVISGAFMFFFIMGLSLFGKSQNTNESSSKELQKPEKSIGISAETPQEIHAPTLLLDEIVLEVPLSHIQKQQAFENSNVYVDFSVVMRIEDMKKEIFEWLDLQMQICDLEKVDNSQFVEKQKALQRSIGTEKEEKTVVQMYNEIRN
jgi:hypothetical protein